MATAKAEGEKSARGSVLGRALAALTLASAALVFSLGLAELGLRLVPRPEHYAMLLPGSRIIDPDPRFVHGVEGPAHYDVTPAGYRGREFGPDSSEYRILLVGGSTTECAILDYSENWGTIVEQELNPAPDGRATWVGNVGRSGLTARDHAVTVKYLLQEYPRIDLVLVLVGINDLTAALRQGQDYIRPRPITDPEAERLQIRSTFAISPEGMYRPNTEAAGDVRNAWYRSLRLYDLARRARLGTRANEVQRSLGGSNVGKWRANRQSASRTIDQLPDLTAPLADYRTNLEAIVEPARAHGADVVFLTQPTLWAGVTSPAIDSLLWLGGTGPFQDVPGQEYYSLPALIDAMSQYNRTTLDVCREEQLSCFDLAAALPPDTTLLYDDVHFTEAGSALVGKLVAEHLREAWPTRASQLTSTSSNPAQPR